MRVVYPYRYLCVGSRLFWQQLVGTAAAKKDSQRKGGLPQGEMEPEEYAVDSDSDVDIDEDSLRNIPSSSSSSPPSSSSPSSLSSSTLFKSSASSKKTNRNKSMFKTSRRLSGMPNMILNSMMKLDGTAYIVRPTSSCLSNPDYVYLLQLHFNPKDLSPEDLAKVNELIAKFPAPPDKIYVPPSSVSNMKSSVTNYFKGFFSGGSSSGKEQTNTTNSTQRVV